MKLSIIIPVYNEEETIAEVIYKVNKENIQGIEKELIIINDGSTDATRSIILNLKTQITNKKIIHHPQNKGKGAAIGTGIKYATGEYILIQDADLEYNPKDYKNLLIPIIQKKAEVVYGTRLNRLPDFSKDERTVRFSIHYLGNKILSLLASTLYKQWLTDMETGYKVFPKKALKTIKLNAKGFDFEPEITAKLLKKGYHIIEVPISTNPRDYKAGKKLNTIKDGIKAIKTLFKYRFID